MGSPQNPRLSPWGGSASTVSASTHTYRGSGAQLLLLHGLGSSVLQGGEDVKRTGTMYPSAYGRWANQRRLPSPTLMEGLAGTGLPVLLMWGAPATLLPVEALHRAHGRLPNSRLAVMEVAGHSPQAERPEVFLRTLEEFLANRPGAVDAGGS